MSHDFRRAIEEIKLRAPIEDVVREHVPTLRKRGALWEACCPFHTEKTPSFKVNPTRGTWHCFGACSEGGDQIAFVERITGLGFMEVLEILADRTGVELPKKNGRSARERGADPAYEVLKRAAQVYAQCLRGPEGAEARRYLAQRGLDSEVIESFGIGFSPAAGHTIVDMARAENLPWELLEKAGLARKNDRGRAYDFFRGRLMIPIRDVDGRTVGFGARRLDDEAGGPKYINTAETPLFKKSRLVYGLDLALREARRHGHLILVEGYTDVMAAHQVGLARVGAVLGTATTDDHARLVRRSGARRVSLVFDGDEAGRKAARRAIHGLLPLEVELEVVTLPVGEDPCDLLIRGGAEGFLAHVEAGVDWFSQALGELEGLMGAQLSQQVDELLVLLARVPRPVHRQSLLGKLAEHLGLPLEALREQWRTSEAGRRQRRPVAPAVASEQGPGEGDEPAHLQGPDHPQELPRPARPIDPRIRRAFEEIIGAVLLDNSLVPKVKPLAELCQDPDLGRILELVLEMYETDDTIIDAGAVLTGLGDHTARACVARLVTTAETAASPQELLDGALAFLNKRRLQRRQRELERQALVLERELLDADATGEATRAVKDELNKVLAELNSLLRIEKTPSELTSSSLSHTAD